MVFISNYIHNTIALEYSNNEKLLRESRNESIEQINKFHDIEENLLSNVYDEVFNNYQFTLNIIDLITSDLILRDYITYFLQKYKNKEDIYNIDDIYHNIIDLIIQLLKSISKMK